MNILESLKLAEENLVNTVSAYTVQIIKVAGGTTGEEYPDALGTGVFVKLNASHFILTAGHVYENIEEPQMILARGCCKFISLPAICGKSFSPIISQSPDIALIPILREAAEGLIEDGFKFASGDFLDITHEPVQRQEYMIYGFPETKTKIRFKEHITKNVCFSCFIEANAAESDDTRIAFNFPIKGWKRFGDENTCKPPRLNGMSGCGIWHFNVDGVKLVGVFVEKQNQLLYATRLSTMFGK